MELLVFKELIHLAKKMQTAPNAPITSAPNMSLIYSWKGDAEHKYSSCDMNQCAGRLDCEQRGIDLTLEQH